jgi:hypothetical protein
LQGKLVVMYSGNHSLCHPLTTVLGAARILQTNRDIVFCFIGGGAQFRGIEQAAQRAKHERGGGPRILCLPYQPLARLSASLSAADLQLVVMGDPFVGIVHPCKIYNLLRLPTPIIFVGPKPSPVSEILDERPGAGRSACVSHGDPEALAGHIRSLLMDAGGVGEQPCEAASRFSRERVVPRLIAELEGQGRGRGAMSEVMFLNKIDLR